MKSSKIRLVTSAFAVATLATLFFFSCRKEEISSSPAKDELTDMKWRDPVDFSDPAQLQSVIGKNYDPTRSNLFGMPEELLNSIPSDELFGIEPRQVSMPTEEKTEENAAYPEQKHEFPQTTERGVDAAGAGTYTWLYRNPSHKLVYNFDVILNIDQHPTDPAYLLFWALQVNFGDANGIEHDNQGAHIGLQWWNGKKANWGGYWSIGVPPGGATTINYPWIKGRPYRLRVWRLGSDGFILNWGGWVKDLVTQQETFIGTFPTWTINNWITSHVVWTEAPNVICTTNVQADFSMFQYKRADGPDSTIQHAVCDYNGGSGCNNPHKTNVTGGNWLWTWTRHKYNTTRTNPPGTQLW